VADRDEFGRFVKGNQAARGHRGGSGRLPRKREDKLFSIFTAEVKPDDIREITKTAIARAKAGDGQARQWLWNYLFGKAIERTEQTDRHIENVLDVLERIYSEREEPE